MREGVFFREGGCSFGTDELRYHTPRQLLRRGKSPGRRKKLNGSLDDEQCTDPPHTHKCEHNTYPAYGTGGAVLHHHVPWLKLHEVLEHSQCRGGTAVKRGGERGMYAGMTSGQEIVPPTCCCPETVAALNPKTLNPQPPPDAALAPRLTLVLHLHSQPAPRLPDFTTHFMHSAAADSIGMHSGASRWKDEAGNTPCCRHVPMHGCRGTTQSPSRTPCTCIGKRGKGKPCCLMQACRGTTQSPSRTPCTCTFCRKIHCLRRPHHSHSRLPSWSGTLPGRATAVPPPSLK